MSLAVSTRARAVVVAPNGGSGAAPADGSAAARSAVGQLLRSWREHRRLSKLALADKAEVSTQHLSCVETGRARPSRGFLLHLAEHLDLPLRAHNQLLVAGGCAPLYGQTDLDAPEMAQVCQVLDRCWPAPSRTRSWSSTGAGTSSRQPRAGPAPGRRRP